MSDLHTNPAPVEDSLRTRIAAVLNSFPADMRPVEVVNLEKADAVIRELEPELNRHNTGCVCDDCWGDEHA